MEAEGINYAKRNALNIFLSQCITAYGLLQKGPSCHHVMFVSPMQKTLKPWQHKYMTYT